MDIKIDEDNIGHITFLNGNLFVTGSRQDSLRQRLDIRLKTQLGSWYLNTLYGIDWLDTIFQFGTTKLTIDTLIQAEILKEPFVSSIISFDSDLNGRTGIYSLSFKVKLIDETVSDVVRVLANENMFVVVDIDGKAVRVV